MLLLRERLKVFVLFPLFPVVVGVTSDLVLHSRIILRRLVKKIKNLILRFFLNSLCFIREMIICHDPKLVYVVGYVKI